MCFWRLGPRRAAVSFKKDRVKIRSTCIFYCMVLAVNGFSLHNRTANLVVCVACNPIPSLKALSGMKRVLLSCGFLCAVCPTAVFTVIARSWVRSKCEKTLRYFKHSMVKRNARTPVRVKSIARSARGMGEGKHCWQTFKHSCPDRTARKKNLVTAFAAYADGKEGCRLKFGCWGQAQARNMSK